MEPRAGRRRAAPRASADGRSRRRDRIDRGGTAVVREPTGCGTCRSTPSTRSRFGAFAPGVLRDACPSVVRQLLADVRRRGAARGIRRSRVSFHRLVRHPAEWDHSQFRRIARARAHAAQPIGAASPDRALDACAADGPTRPESAMSILGPNAGFDSRSVDGRLVRLLVEGRADRRACRARPFVSS